MLRSDLQRGVSPPPTPLLLGAPPSPHSNPVLSSLPPCCNCHSRHGPTAQNGYLSCLDVNRGVPLAWCECKGNCPAGRCALQCCVSSQLAASRERSSRVPAEGQYRRPPKRARSLSSTSHSPPSKRTTSTPLTSLSHVVRLVVDDERDVVNSSLAIDQSDSEDDQPANMEEKYDDEYSTDHPHLAHVDTPWLG